MSAISQKLKDLGITLPDPAAPVATYVACVQSGGMLFVSGQLPLHADGMIKGHLGKNVTIDQGKQAAQLCAIQILAQAQKFLGNLERIERLVKLTGFVSCTGDFTDHPAVMNGASDFMVQVLGEAGKHARAAVGVASLPLGAAVEVEAIFEIKEESV